MCTSSEWNLRDLIVRRDISSDALAHVVNQCQLNDLVQVEVLLLFRIEEKRGHDRLGVESVE